MVYKPGTYLVGDTDLTIFISKGLMLAFKNLSKAAIKSLKLCTPEYIEVVEDAKAHNDPLR